MELFLALYLLQYYCLTIFKPTNYQFIWQVRELKEIQQQDESIDIKAIFLKLVKYWYLFALTIFVAVAIAFLFNKYTNPVYEVSASVLSKN